MNSGSRSSAPSRRAKSLVATAAMTVSAALLLAGCAGGAGEASGATLKIGAGGVFTSDNNPFSSASSSRQGWIWLQYEPLAQANTVLTSREPLPWLASDYEWAEDYKSVTFTARDGVEWSDGEAFTAEDIGFTFELLAENPALNANSLDIEDVTVSGSDATITFATSQFVKEANVLNQFVVPEHIWADVEDPATFENTEPVGTGPFVFTSATSSVTKLDKNENYWQVDKVAVEDVIFQSFQGNDPTLNALAAHEIDWANAFALNQNEGFVDKDPSVNFALNVPKLGIDVFLVNTAKAPFDSVELRRAMSLVIDRERAVSLATGGILGPVTNVSGLPQPVGDAYIAPDLQGVDFEVNLDAAKAELEAGGFTLDGDTLYDPQGAPVTMTLIDPAGWTDFITELQVIGEDLAQIGIETSIETPSQETVSAALATGDFDGAMWYSNSGSTPYDIYAGYMDGKLLEPIGTTAKGNYNRFDNPAATAALETYANSPDAAAREEALWEVQRIFAEEIPAIPVVSKVSGAMFTGVNWTGWPTEDDVYADPNFRSINFSLILTRLVPAE